MIMTSVDIVQTGISETPKRKAKPQISSKCRKTSGVKDDRTTVKLYRTRL